MGRRFSIVHGAYNRASAQVASAETTYWSKGRLLTINASGQIIVHTGTKTTQGASTGYPTVGLALENRVNPSTVGPTTTLNKASAPVGEKASFVVDEAVVYNDELRSGVDFHANDLLYVSTDGKVTISGQGTGPNSPIIGVAWSDAHGNDANRPLLMYFSVTY